VLMIIAGYMGAVSVVTTVKWFWFLFGMAMFLPVVYSLARTFRETVITRKVCFLMHGRATPLACEICAAIKKMPRGRRYYSPKSCSKHCWVYFLK
jgi:hypothetical protein